MEEYDQTGQVSRVEDNDNVLDVGAILLDILAEFLGDLAVALQEVFPGHAGLAGSTAGRNDIFGILECDSRIGRPGDGGTLECAMGHLGDNAFQSGFVNIVQADVRRQFQHHGRLGHIGADHTGRTHDGQLLICQKFHN